MSLLMLWNSEKTGNPENWKATVFSENVFVNVLLMLWNSEKTVEIQETGIPQFFQKI